jgi:hypothetical protein
MIRACTDEMLIEAVIAECGHARQWRVQCGHQDENAGTSRRGPATIRWRDGNELFMAIRHREVNGTTCTTLLSAPNTADGRAELGAAADALNAEFARASAGFERLLECLRG